MSYDEDCRRWVADAIAKGHSDPADLREILVWTTCRVTAQAAEIYLARHRTDPELLNSLVAIALEGEDAGDAPWAAANTIAKYPGAMLVHHKASLESIAREQWMYLHVPAREALAKVEAVERAVERPLP